MTARRAREGRDSRPTLSPARVSTGLKCHSNGRHYDYENSAAMKREIEREHYKNYSTETQIAQTRARAEKFEMSIAPPPSCQVAIGQSSAQLFTKLRLLTSNYAPFKMLSFNSASGANSFFSTRLNWGLLGGREGVISSAFHSCFAQSISAQHPPPIWEERGRLGAD